jgi:hypothetical protein
VIETQSRSRERRFPLARRSGRAALLSQEGSALRSCRPAHPFWPNLPCVRQFVTREYSRNAQEKLMPRRLVCTE